MSGQTVSGNGPVGAAGNPANTDAASAKVGRPFPTGRGKNVVAAKGRAEAIERRMAGLKKKGK